VLTFLALLCTSIADIHPAFAPLNATPAVETSDVSPSNGGNCFADSTTHATWVTVAATIQTSLSREALLGRFGAISELQQVQYWSTTDQAWRPMVSAAYAVSSANTEQPRADYSSAELAGPTRYYRITDTRTYVPVNYSLQIHPAAHGQIFVETTNVDPIKKWGFTLYRPDGLHTLYFLSERSPGIWTYYSITRAAPATFLAGGHEKSYVNRAIALYRHYLELPPTTDPPAAR
jgi:uncharacterized protein DUF6675